MLQYLEEHIQKIAIMRLFIFWENKRSVSTLKMLTALELTFQCHNFVLSMCKLNLKSVESNMKYFNKFLLLPW